MRFSDDGPDVPNELIQLQRQGDVAFVVGAGISKRADLPLFEELTRLIYQAAREPLPGEPLSLAGKGEIDAFQAKEWDRALGLLERRVSFRNPQLPDSLHLTRVRQEAENLLNYKPGSKLDAHSAILNISRDGHGRPRLITTNFDTLLERAAVQLRKEPPPSYAGQAMPPVGGPDFHGILHLHGRIEDREVDCGRTELILTSGDFGEAYLRAGWASPS